MPKVQPRDISPILQKMRDFLLGRQFNSTLRFEPQVSARTQPPPVLPDGPAHKMSDNYYYTRDVRREVKQPLDVNQQLLEASGKKGETTKVATKIPTPGPAFQWDQHY